MNFLLQRNIEKLNRIATLENNWDGNDAKPFDPAFITNIKQLLIKLDQKQPNIFPINNSSIQAEFYIQTNYLELTISKTECEAYITDGKNLSRDIFENFDYDENKILSIVRNFYFTESLWSRHPCDCTAAVFNRH